MRINLQSQLPAPSDGYIPVEHCRIYIREIGLGQPLIILHGGPDFDHSYLLPDLDRLSDAFRLIYYDQRGRGKSARNIQPDEVTIQSDIDDLEILRKFFHLDNVALLGHSWGSLLALEYVIRHPQRVSHLILMNSAPVSHSDYILFRQDRLNHAAADVEELKSRRSNPKYQQGDPDAVAKYYRIHFRATLRQPELLDEVIHRLRLRFTQGGILKARAIEDRLIQETWLSSEYNLLPKLEPLVIPTLILHGEFDLIPVECAVHIAQAIAGSRFVLLRECGHFSYIERLEDVRKAIADFFSQFPFAERPNPQDPPIPPDLQRKQD